jgi:hypothetical protein
MPNPFGGPGNIATPDHGASGGRARQDAQPLNRAEPLTLERIESALAKLAENNSLRHRVPMLAALQSEVAFVEKIMPDSPPPGRNVRPVNQSESVGANYEQAAEQATQQMKRAVGA